VSGGVAVSARDEICNLMYEYAERMDAGDFAAIADMLAHAKITLEADPNWLLQGREQIFDAYSRVTRLYDDGTPKTKHVTTNVIVEVESDVAASSRSYFTVLQAIPGSLALQPILSGRYRNRFEHVDGSWRYSAMHVIWDLVGDMSAHTTEDLS
jgi:hypothetical protein